MSIVMRCSSLLLLFIAGASVVACGGSASESGAGANAGSAGLSEQAGSAGLAGVQAGSAGVAGEPDLPAVWNEHSRHISIHCDSYFFGQRVLRGDRTQMSPEQLDLLAHLKQSPTSSACFQDSTGCQVSITDDAGLEQSYDAFSGDGQCNGSQPAIAYDELAALLDASGCKAGNLDAPPLAESAVCLHGLFITGSTPERQKLLLSEPGRVYHLELDQCPGPEFAPQLSLQLFGADSAVPIATGSAVSTPGPDQACLALDVTVTEATTAEVVVGAQSGGGAVLLQFR